MQASKPKRKYVKKKGDPKRRGPKGWASPAMVTHLQGKIPSFQAAQASNDLANWWPSMHSEFGQKFPLPQLTTEEIAAGVKIEDKLRDELKRIKTWFNNNGRAGQQNEKMLLNLHPEVPKPKKRLSMMQAYSKKYYPTVLKPIADSRYEEHLRDAKENNYKPMKPLEHSNKVVAEYWKKEPQTIIDEIAEYWEYLYLHPEAADRNDESEYSNDDPEDDWLDDDGPHLYYIIYDNIVPAIVRNGR
ncbi:hypothetical protein HWV62_43722 [Athelia sp. TMB]|nr:hypothetical protein HWV62_43722 [Athelia sp. TMB]